MASAEPQRAPTFIDLFSGCGGLSLGFLEAGFRGLLAVDSDAEAVRAYNQNLRGPDDGGAVEYNLARLTSRAHVRAFLDKHGVTGTNCDVLVGGPPCQSFSVVGRNKVRALVQSNGNLNAYWRKKNRERTALCNVYARFLEVLAPRWFVFENVPAITSHESYDAICRRFRRLRRPDGRRVVYEIVASTYVASDYGVPQARRRFIMVGRRSNLAIDEWLGPQEQSLVTVADALDDLPAVPNGHEARVCAYGSSKSGAAYARAMRAGMPTAFRGKVVDHICRTQNADDVALFERMKPGARFADSDVQRAIQEINPRHKLLKYATDKFADKLHRLDPTRDAWTVTAHMQKDCYKFIHHYQARTITVREAARLQSFPDWFDFLGFGMGTAFRLIGNAVPPVLACAFAQSIVAADKGLAPPRVTAFRPPCDETKRQRVGTASEAAHLPARESVRLIRASTRAGARSGPRGEQRSVQAATRQRITPARSRRLVRTA